MSDLVLAIRGLRRSYATGDRTLDILNGIDLDLVAGEVVGLIGPSGSGKSSLLHAAGLLERPTAGQIFVEGRDCSTLNDRARTRVRLSTIGFVYQAHHLLQEFSALDNVALPQLMAGRPRGAARDRAADLLTQLGLAERLTHQPAQLSGGEQQRVAIARALANAPRLLLADEPTGNLDSSSANGVMDLLFAQVAERGMTLLLVTHDEELAKRYAARVIRVQDGRVESVQGS